MSASAYPLTWPDLFPRSKSREAGRFKTSMPTALKNVRNSLDLFGRDSRKKVEGIVLSSNVSLGNDRPQDPGVAVWFTWDGIQVCIPVDRYQKPEDNLQAIHHILEARRVELRHGTLAIVRATMTGFTALPAPSTKRAWHDVLQVRPDASVEVIEANYRRLAKFRHPDQGGSTDEMAELNAARTEALKERT